MTNLMIARPMLVDTSAVREALKKGAKFWEQDGEEFRLGPSVRVCEQFADDDACWSEQNDLGEPFLVFDWALLEYVIDTIGTQPSEADYGLCMACGNVELTPAYLATPVVFDGARYHRHPNGGGLIHPKATVHPTAYVGPRSKVHAWATVHPRALIDNATVGPGAVVGELAELGRGVVLGRKAIVGYNSRVGKDTVVEDGADTGIASFVDAHLFIGECLTIPDGCNVHDNVWY